MPNFAQMRFNVVRLPISWANPERFKDWFDAVFLARYVNRDVQWPRNTDYTLYWICTNGFGRRDSADAECPTGQ